ncbi:MAG: helix-turn-helix domain-containing protein [Solirubrobacterales bacterium]
MSKQLSKSPKRPYRKRRRAELEEETRRRITEAAVDLHGSIGPARTTISAVAERAGVQRATVYRYFPDEEALFGACSAHWLSEHPLPDLARWATIEGPGERLHAALSELYAWFDRGEEMVEKTIRDATLVPAMAPPMEAMGAWFAAATAAIVHGRPERGARRRQVKAVIGHAVSFATWRSLVREQGLPQAEAVALMADLVATAARG